jgi:hypothetical protein
VTHREIDGMTRAELVAYLESWGFQCYDSETDAQLREAAHENHKTERDT